MLIRISGLATVGDGAPVAAHVTHALDGLTSDETCTPYLAKPFRQLTGGHVRLSSDGHGGFRVRTEYGSAGPLTPSWLDTLIYETVGQWSDGVGEGCFDAAARRHGVTIDLFPREWADHLRLDLVADDGAVTPHVPFALAQAAAEGDLARVRQLIDAGADLEADPHKVSPLHRAVAGGHAAVAVELVRRGAAVTPEDPSDDDMLLCVAVSKRLSDADSVVVAAELIALGVRSHLPSADADAADRDTPLDWAARRGKPLLAAWLRSAGATR